MPSRVSGRGARPAAASMCARGRRPSLSSASLLGPCRPIWRPRSMASDYVWTRLTSSTSNSWMSTPIISIALLVAAKPRGSKGPVKRPTPFHAAASRCRRTSASALLPDGKSGRRRHLRPGGRGCPIATALAQAIDNATLLISGRTEGDQRGRQGEVLTHRGRVGAACRRSRLPRVGGAPALTARCTPRNGSRGQPPSLPSSCWTCSEEAAAPRLVDLDQPSSRDQHAWAEPGVAAGMRQ